MFLAGCGLALLVCLGKSSKERRKVEHAVVARWYGRPAGEVAAQLKAQALPQSMFLQELGMGFLDFIVDDSLTNRAGSPLDIVAAHG